MLRLFGVKGGFYEKGSFRRETERIHLNRVCPTWQKNRTVSSVSLRQFALTPSRRCTPACFVVQDPPSLRDESILFQEAPYLHSTVHLSCCMVSEDGRNYKFSPVLAAKSPRSCRRGVDDELMSFSLPAQSSAIYHQ